MKEVSAKQVEDLLNEGKALKLIDVRDVDEVSAGKIPGAINIPLGLLEARMPDLDKSEEYIIVCRSGGRSGLAAQFLESYGYNAINLKDGMLGWQGAIE